MFTSWSVEDNFGYHPIGAKLYTIGKSFERFTKCSNCRLDLIDPDLVKNFNLVPIDPYCVGEIVERGRRGEYGLMISVICPVVLVRTYSVINNLPGPWPGFLVVYNALDSRMSLKIYVRLLGLPALKHTMHISLGFLVSLPSR